MLDRFGWKAPPIIVDENPFGHLGVPVGASAVELPSTLAMSSGSLIVSGA